MSLFWIVLGFIACMAVEAWTPATYDWIRARLRAGWDRLKGRD